MAAGSYGTDLIQRDFGRLTARAGWNGVAGAFGKLQEEANGGRVHGWGAEEGEEGRAQESTHIVERRRGDLCRGEQGIAVAWRNTEFFPLRLVVSRAIAEE